MNKLPLGSLFYLPKMLDMECIWILMYYDRNNDMVFYDFLDEAEYNRSEHSFKNDIETGFLTPLN